MIPFKKSALPEISDYEMIIPIRPQFLRKTEYFIAVSKDCSVSGYKTHLACSRDLVNWKIWNGKPLIEPTEPWKNIHAHKKTWFLRHNGVNYHYYCAVNTNNERFIAVATSE